MTRAREVFEASEDFTVGIEEEFGILDPQTRDLVPRFVELRDAPPSHVVMAWRDDGRAGPLRAAFLAAARASLR